MVNRFINDFSNKLKSMDTRVRIYISSKKFAYADNLNLISFLATGLGEIIYSVIILK